MCSWKKLIREELDPCRCFLAHAKVNRAKSCSVVVSFPLISSKPKSHWDFLRFHLPFDQLQLQLKETLTEFDKLLKAFSLKEKKQTTCCEKQHLENVPKNDCYSSFSKAGRIIVGRNFNIPIVGVKLEFNVRFWPVAGTRSKSGGGLMAAGVTDILALLEVGRLRNWGFRGRKEGNSDFTCFLRVGVWRLLTITGISREATLFPPNVGVGNTPGTLQ